MSIKNCLGAVVALALFTLCACSNSMSIQEDPSDKEVISQAIIKTTAEGAVVTNNEGTVDISNEEVVDTINIEPAIEPNTAEKTESKSETTEPVEETEVTDSIDLEIEPIKPALLSFSFPKKANKLSHDISCNIRENDLLECFPKESLNSNLLTASFEFEGDSITLADGKNFPLETNALDYSKAVSLTVHSGDQKRIYEVHLYPYTGFPYISVETDNGMAIDKSSLKGAQIRVMEDPDIQKLGSSKKCSIIGHGNSTWEKPKKPYLLKFDDKTSLLSLPKGKSWVMIANYFDKTMIRNSMAMYLSSLSNASFTPQFQYFELILNGQYKGTYQLFEKVTVSKKRVNIGDKDYLLEVDNHPRAKDTYFSLDNLPKPIKIHEPQVSEGDKDYNYIKETMEHIEAVLFSDNFLDETDGYKKYIDIDALVEWFVVTEITETPSNRVNWYMTYERNGKLKMGPFWDYDLAFGNSLWTPYANEIERIWMSYLAWFKQFLKDLEFKKKTAERFNYFYSKKADILSKADEYAEKVKYSVVPNEREWGTLECDSCSAEKIHELYDQELSKMKTWLDARMEWLSIKFNEMAN